MRHLGSVLSMFAAAAACSFCACTPDGVEGDDDGGDDAPDANTGPDADVGDQPCSMAGRWIAEQHVVSTALGADQRTTTWYYYEIEQAAGSDTFTITKVNNCGLVVDGTTTVGLDDATLGALATNEAAGPGRQGTFKVSGDQCEFSLDRSYNLRGANKDTFLLDVWQVGDPPKPLSEFPALPTAPAGGMEDWEPDNMDGITLHAGTLGNRYVCQRDWNEHEGTAPQFAAKFGGDGVINVTWDGQEGISEQTTPFLRVTAAPKPGGWARYARAPNLPTGVSDLQLCKAVQDLAAETWPP
jgi:hypothetical protein